MLRADSIRPYSLGGEAAAIQRTALSRQVSGGLAAPTGAHPSKLHLYRNAVRLLLRIIAEQSLNAFVKF